MEENILTKKDIEFNNLNFWYYHISSIRGFDDDKELNLDEAIEEAVNIEKHIPSFDDWYASFCPEDDADEDGMFENPKEVSGMLTDDMSFAIEFHSSETTFFLNDIYIGNMGGHFEAWFLTLKELIAFDKYDALFLLLLPMVGIEENERQDAEKLISEKLKSISMFAEQSEYITKCIVNGLVVDTAFYTMPNVGLVCDTNHCIRNVTKYPEYKDDVVELNNALEAFVKN